jgi:hypothetical protein
VIKDHLVGRLELHCTRNRMDVLVAEGAAVGAVDETGHRTFSVRQPMRFRPLDKFVRQPPTDVPTNERLHDRILTTSRLATEAKLRHVVGRESKQAGSGC